jgi:hypothetical protein
MASPLPELLQWDGDTKLLEVVVGGPMTCEYRRERSDSESTEPLPAPSTCGEAVQGQIAWDYEGSTEWAPRNVWRLCAGAETTKEPAICFEEAMHGGLPGRHNIQWRWQDALALCAGTTDAEGTIGCYRSERDSGSSSEDAIAACGAQKQR